MARYKVWPRAKKLILFTVYIQQLKQQDVSYDMFLYDRQTFTMIFVYKIIGKYFIHEYDSIGFLKKKNNNGSALSLIYVTR